MLKLKYLSSIKLTIVLLVLIVLASIVGTVIPQTWTNEQYKARYGDASGILMALQLTDVYHSVWYRVLLAAFCIQLCVCSTRSLTPLIKSLMQSSSTAGSVDPASLPFYRKIPLRADIEDAELEMRQILARSLYRLKYSDAARGIYYFERGKLGRLGPLITHASVVIILIGGIFVGTFGFRGHKRITVGETVDVPHADFQLRADDFKVEFYQGVGTPKEYTSVLTVIENGEPKLTKSIEVNHPLTYKGVKFYQSSYGMSNSVDVELLKKAAYESEEEVLGKYTITVGEMFPVPDSQLKIKALVIVPDFVRDESGRVGSRSNEPRNPAGLFELYEGDELKDKMWRFMRFADFHGSGESEYTLKFLSTKYYTELQVSRDPGLPAIWFGSLLMVTGMFLSFYLSYRRLWIKISSDDAEPFMEVGGRSYKNRSGFDREFHRLEEFFGKHG